MRNSSQKYNFSWNEPHYLAWRWGTPKLI